MIRHPAVEDERDLQVIIINLLAIEFRFYDPTPVLNNVVQSMKAFDNLREFATSVRNDIYYRMYAYPLDKASSNAHLIRDISELLQEWTVKQGTMYSTLRSNLQPERGLEAESILRTMNRLLALQICDYSSDISLKLIVACGIALSNRLQVIAYDQSSSLVRYCWLVCDRLERFPSDPDDNSSSQSRWSTISPRINHVQPINHYLSGPPPPVSSSQEIKKILSFVERIEQKVGVILNIGRNKTKSGAPPGLSKQCGPPGNIAQQQLHVLLHQQSRCIQQNNKILSYLAGDDVSCQQSDKNVPSCRTVEESLEDNQ